MKRLSKGKYQTHTSCIIRSINQDAMDDPEWSVVYHWVRHRLYLSDRINEVPL